MAFSWLPFFASSALTIFVKLFTDWIFLTVPYPLLAFEPPFPGPTLVTNWALVPLSATNHVFASFLVGL